ncbi:unnamed protein product [Lepeophtheirus salmonis]|uniref:(salmon louse) hypothetical protein n=1 Tax=Lepeophtheirus salmonis TaxID=72036 RepID=A0A7R8H8Z6_LEPSM|nr:unnamed protein product [Lepeophtheirus salmonis]CAF2948196.1 unnamed protein product [Lepeophtheirus salmonis]
MHNAPSRQLTLTMDASPLGLGAVPFQWDKDKELPVAFASPIMFGLTKLKRYLLGRPFTIKTDHKPLEYILSPKKQLPQVVTARLARSELSHADAFSRGTFDEPLPINCVKPRMLQSLEIGPKKAIARQKLWGPSIDEDISGYATACETCQAYELLLSYRSTPLNGRGTQAKLLLTRPIRTCLDGFITSYAETCIKLPYCK